jgi:hypothetical protein
MTDDTQAAVELRWSQKQQEEDKMLAEAREHTNNVNAEAEKRKAALAEANENQQRKYEEYKARNPQGATQTANWSAQKKGTTTKSPTKGRRESPQDISDGCEGCVLL